MFKEAIERFIQVRFKAPRKVLDISGKRVLYLRGFPGEEDEGFTAEMVEELTSVGVPVDVVAGNDPSAITEHLQGKRPGQKAELDGVDVTRVE